MIRIEFYGVARLRTKTAEFEIEASTGSIRFGDLLNQLVQVFPNLGPDLIHDGQLGSSLVANLDGKMFLSSFDTQIDDGESVLIMSADAGG